MKEEKKNTKTTFTRKDVRFQSYGEGDSLRTIATITVDGYNYSVTEFNCFHKRTIKAFLIKELEKMAGITINEK